jgi:hypothetical protein
MRSRGWTVRRKRLLALLPAATVLAACSHPASLSPGYTAPPAPTPSVAAAPWPAPSDPLGLARSAGLVPDVREYFTFHVHAHLDVFVNGSPVLVPAGIGINIDDPAVHHASTPYGPGYGGITMCAQPCISPLHTHQGDGVIHTEAREKQPFRLGQFFTEWDVRLDSSCVGGYCRPAGAIAVFVDGKRYTGNPADIVLADHEEIAIVIGSPPSTVPARFPATPSPVPTATG